MIMAGGKGTRFWPWSVKDKPKQFLSLLSNETMIQTTYKRFSQWLSSEKIFVVTTEEYLGLVMEQLPELSPEQVIVEPYQRDTAPSVALTALHFLDKGDDEVLVMSPADQYISNSEALKESLLLAEEIASDENAIVTLGIKPTRPETGYGYIKSEQENEEEQVLKVTEFIEKPSLNHAKDLVNNSNVFWNSGIFVWRPSTIAYYMKKYQGAMWNELNENKNIFNEIYGSLPKISVDYAILEKAEKIYMIPSKFKWDDLGTWKSIERIYEKDSNKNILIGDIRTVSAQNCIIISQDQKVLVLGVEDLIIALTEDGLLVCQKSHEQKIKKILNSWSEEINRNE
ncbi:sugar phosphate nucleotidyltransferase [Cytobacillus firmus]|uniref:mannose-1-phosphate guanylyltransferase n=1 Tax=Cytobacillus firmus TaxID=1399 RepID=UPI002867C486|nr:sugar phosphate nucleotidyltransferase [Cytobacillus firmus]